MTSQRFAEDAALVRRSRAGDTEAFTQLVGRYENAAYAIALNRVRNAEDAKDIVQDAFVAAYCKLVQLRAPERFGSWLRAIVQTRSLEWIRRQRTIPISAYTMGAIEGNVARMSASQYANDQRSADLWDTVDALPEKYREVVLMYYLNDFSYSEIADFMGLPVSTVKGRLQQSRIKLREHLSSIETEEIAMTRAQVEQKVEEAICKIAREEIQRTIPLGDTDHIVLYCGVNADIEICHTDGDDVVLTGTKTSIGLSEEDARASVANIQVLSDQVESYLETGPHPGEIFTGSRVDGDNITGFIENTAEEWMSIKEDQERISSQLSRIYPEMVTLGNELFHLIRDAVCKKSTRISVIREHMEDITFPHKDYTETVKRVFKPNYWDSDKVYGPIGRVDLVLALPASRKITILSGDHIRVWGLRSDVSILNGSDVELSDIEGDVCLLNTSVKKAQGIRGRFLQSFYVHSGADWRHQAEPLSVPDSILQDITGETRVDLGTVKLQVSDLKGKVDIRNRFGSTRLHLNAHEDGSRYRIESDSGEVLVFLKEEVIGELNFTVNTICGSIKHDAINDRVRSKSTGAATVTLSTIPSPRAEVTPQQLDADLYVKTRDGDVTIEKTM